MDYIKLGKSALEISRIGFGCMSLKGDLGDNKSLISKALDYGINYFDTADLYDAGLNEELVGKALKGARHKAIIATKVGNQLLPGGSTAWNPTKQYIIQSIDKSLKRLQVEYIDLYQLHGGTIDDPIDETIEAFERLQQQGKIRYYGISSIRPNVIKEYVLRSNIVSVMMQYSLLDRRPEESCLQLLKANNIGILARGSVASGLLVDKPAKPYLNYTTEQVQQAAAAIKSLVTTHRSSAQAAIQFALNHPAISAAVVGTRTAHQLIEAVETMVSEPLTPGEIKQLHDAIPLNFYTDHR